MKSFITYILLSLSVFTFGQETPTAFEGIELEAVSLIEADTLQIDLINTITETNSFTPIDIKAAHWDTTVFNPYKDIKLEFPLRLDFTDSSYAAPMNFKKVVTSRYGWRRGRAHRGIDIDLVTGDSVMTMFDGIVRFANYHSGHGRTVIVRHYNGLETVYAHFSRYAVKVNDSVKRGQLLGKGGTSGNARGSHLHLRVNYKGVAINPEYVFNFNENNDIRSPEIWVTRQWATPYYHSSKRQSKLELLVTEDEAMASLIKEKTIYVVKRGDTLSGISSRNQISIRAICATNNIKKTSLLKIGQKLVLEL